MSTMQSRAKLLLFNLAVAAALIFQWRHHVPLKTLIITAIVIFPLVNVLLIFAAKKSTYSKYDA